MKRLVILLCISILYCTSFAFPQTTMTKDVIQGVSYQHQETLPEFPGGLEKLMKFISKNRIYQNDQDKNIGTVRLKFMVMNDGSIGDSVIVTSSLSEYYDKEAIRIVKSMPKWKPATIDGKPVNILYNLPVKF